ncbi:phage tail protein [Trinickia terrae]|uniref:Phage tail protein n=1 Tax=Trinickia terrae TaxID=2571161 RepID=A0A4U1HUK0_9BURK|nr:phage tail protein [Trinickia terrae]TKC83838.1 phage tail protein [Trinickia terrae]
MDNMQIEIDIKEATAVLHGLPPSAMQAAWRRTLRKTSAWIKSQTAKEVGAATKIPQKVIRHRIYFFLRSSDTGKVWLGLNPIEAHRLGNATRTRKGMRVGRQSFEGAWRQSKRNPRGPIYERVGKERMPYRLVTVAWQQAGDPAFRRAAKACEARLMVILRQEVNYELQKVMRRA